MIYDVAVCTVALFYLMGDNLQQNVCEDNCRPCPTIGHAFLGAALILKIFLDLLTVGNLKPKFPSTFPVIGKMGNIYSKLLEVTAAALTIGLTFTTMLKPVDIEKANCNTTVDANTVKGVAIGIMTALCVIVFLIMLVLWGF